MLVRKNSVVIFGGTGFLGRYIVNEIAKIGCKVNILTRDPDHALYLKTCGSIGQVNLVRGDISDDKLVEKLISESDIVINLVGILYESRSGDFAKIHAKFPEKLGKYAKKHNSEKFIHVSALAVNRNTTSKYAASKLEGENALRNKFSKATILRPSVVFGAEDNFINKFAKMALFSPFLPLIGGGRTKFQPVYVNDIAKTVVKIISHKKYDSNTYELGGAEILSFREVFDLMLKIIGKKRFYLNIPFAIANIMGLILERFPNPVLTSDQVKFLATDNVTQNKAKTFYDLGMQPKSIEEIVPEYLSAK